jgi:Ser-tRNA(Ala) deacylase AlaX
MERNITKKVYYQEPFLSTLKAKIVDINENRAIKDFQGR